MRVLVLGGGPDAEHEVSLQSAAGVAQALNESGRFQTVPKTIGLITRAELKALPGDVIFPVLHGPFGEGGPMQDLLEADGRPFVGCGPGAARLAMDKLATKVLAASLGIPVAPCAVLNLSDSRCPIGLPAVVKPVHEGSSVGLHICKDESAWNGALESCRDLVKKYPLRVSMVERYIRGRELTVGVIDGSALPVIEIVPAAGVYDYEAKYTRDDTKYRVKPDLPAGVEGRMVRHSELLFKAMQGRHLSRVDFMLDAAGTAWLLEVNTLPGFTSHSLLPMAAKSVGLPMPDLCARLVEMALRDAGRNGAIS